jgi:hypothetical protein
MSTSRFSPPERIAYFDGQLLASPDLQSDSDAASRFRGLHVRASHNTWGVALGFEVAWRAPAAIQVGPGFAYDAHVHEIISSETLNVGTPVLPVTGDANAWWFDLVISYRQTIERPGGEIGCVSGPNPGEDRPSWRWCYAGEAPDGAEPPISVSSEAKLGEDVPLVRCRVTPKGFDETLDFTVRRQAQGMVRPHVAGAQVQSQMSFDPTRVAFTASINTSAAGFNQTPLYVARVVIPALLTLAAGRETPFSLLGPFVSLRAPTRTGFQLDVRVATNATAVVGRIAFMAAATTTPHLPVQVTWAGVEANGGCTPTLEFLSGLFLFQPIDFFGARMTAGYARWFTGGING